MRYLLLVFLTACAGDVLSDEDLSTEFQNLRLVGYQKTLCTPVKLGIRWELARTNAVRYEKRETKPSVPFSIVASRSYPNWYNFYDENNEIVGQIDFASEESEDFAFNEGTDLDNNLPDIQGRARCSCLASVYPNCYVTDEDR